MWPIFLPIFVPMAVRYEVVVHYHVYGQLPPMRMEPVIENEKRCLGFIDTTTAGAKLRCS